MMEETMAELSGVADEWASGMGGDGGAGWEILQKNLQGWIHVFVYSYTLVAWACQEVRTIPVL
jgi:hypothetical protein